MTIEHFDSAADAVVDVNSAVEKIATGFVFTEGAVWHSKGQFLIFSDIQANRMLRWDAEHGVSVYRDPSRMANGSTWDTQGRLLTCEHATSRVVREEADGRLTVLATHFDGCELNSPNDIVVRRDGSIYFTDPLYGRRAPFGPPRDPQLSHCSVYRLVPGQDLQRLAVNLEQPNGLCFSLDESLLYVNDTTGKCIHSHRVKADGTVESGQLFADLAADEPGAVDGMKMDLEGRIYTCGPGGVHVYLANGKRIARIRFPEEACNFAFGGKDYRTLFVTAATSLYRVRLNASGRPQSFD
jgi:gluconolactonase